MGGAVRGQAAPGPGVVEDPGQVEIHEELVRRPGDRGEGEAQAPREGVAGLPSLEDELDPARLITFALRGDRDRQGAALELKGDGAAVQEDLRDLLARRDLEYELLGALEAQLVEQAGDAPALQGRHHRGVGLDDDRLDGGALHGRLHLSGLGPARPVHDVGTVRGVEDGALRVRGPGVIEAEQAIVHVEAQHRHRGGLQPEGDVPVGANDQGALQERDLEAVGPSAPGQEGELPVSDRQDAPAEGG